MTRVDGLRGQGQWFDALALVDDPLARADLLNEQALFAGDADARAGAEREEDPRELELFEAGEVAAEQGRPDEARRLFEEALDLATTSGATAFRRRIEASLAELA